LNKGIFIVTPYPFLFPPERRGKTKNSHNTAPIPDDDVIG
jgi:hypothetical protein